jgi:hypothetical protein
LFPVCECGNVPLARRLLMQGVPAPAAQRCQMGSIARRVRTPVFQARDETQLQPLDCQYSVLKLNCAEQVGVSTTC